MRIMMVFLFTLFISNGSFTQKSFAQSQIPVEVKFQSITTEPIPESDDGDDADENETARPVYETSGFDVIPITPEEQTVEIISGQVTAIVSALLETTYSVNIPCLDKDSPFGFRLINKSMHWELGKDTSEFLAPNGRLRHMGIIMACDDDENSRGVVHVVLIAKLTREKRWARFVGDLSLENLKKGEVIWAHKLKKKSYWF